MNSKILIVDDDDEIRSIIKILLEREGYLIFEAPDSTTALKIVDETFDLVILDVIMPGKDGFSACIDIREKYTMPILFLTAKTSEYDKHIGFATGCDDYLIKPFSSIELVARVSALIRRYTVYKGKKTPVTAGIFINDLFIDEINNRVLQNDIEIFLTDTEYRLLLLLSKNPKKIFTLQNIYESIWNEPYFYTVNNTIMVHIRNLRKKLNNGTSSFNYIKNVWGRGYCIDTKESIV